MELLKKHTITKNLKFYFKYSLTFAFSMLFFVACQKSNSSDNNNNIAAPPILNPNQIVAGTCTQCNFQQAQLYQVVTKGTNSFPVNVTWQFFGNQAIMAGLHQMYPANWQKLYSGVFFARGTMVVTSSNSYYYGNTINGIVAGQCVIPAGQYAINPISVGTMNNSLFELPQFEAIQANVRILFTLAGQIKDVDGNGQVDGIYAQLVPVHASVNGTATNCNDVGVTIQ